MKKLVRVEAAPGLFVETALVAVPAAVVLAVLHAHGQGTFATHGIGHALLLASCGIATAIPLLLFAAAARRIPLSTVGLLQYVTPLDAAGDRRLRLRRADAAGPAGRFRDRVDRARRLHRRQPATRPGAQASSDRRHRSRRSLTSLASPDRAGPVSGRRIRSVRPETSVPAATVAARADPAGRFGRCSEEIVQSDDTRPGRGGLPAPGRRARGVASVQVAAAGLSRREHEMLAFERQWWRRAGAKETAIRDRFGVPPTRYYQVLNALVDRPDALAADPLLVRRLRRLRAARHAKQFLSGSWSMRVTTIRFGHRGQARGIRQ